MLRLRDYQPHDFENLWQLDQVCFPEGISYSRDELRMYLSLRSAFCIIAEQDGALAGFVIIDSRQGRPAYMVTIDVDPKFRRSGTATTLLEAVEQRLMRSGIAAIRLEVAVNNASAIAFYRRHGFIEIGRKPGYYNGVLDALSLRKDLPAAAIK